MTYFIGKNRVSEFMKNRTVYCPFRKGNSYSFFLRSDGPKKTSLQFCNLAGLYAFAI
jgi:hypothetical protein